MMKNLVALILASLICLSVTCVAFASDTDTTTTDSTFDYSADQKRIEELGIPTIASVGVLKTDADRLWDIKDYSAAADAYAVYAKQANWLANIITAGLEPYYGASYDDRKDFSYSRFNRGYKYDLASSESKANAYKSERNRAMLYEGLCYYNLGNYEVALPLIIKALDLIEIEDEMNWKLGMDTLYAIVGYN